MEVALVVMIKKSSMKTWYVVHDPSSGCATWAVCFLPSLAPLDFFSDLRPQRTALHHMRMEVTNPGMQHQFNLGNGSTVDEEIARPEPPKKYVLLIPLWPFHS